MATALFINRTDLVKNTFINGSVDTDRFIQVIKISQFQHLQIYCGSALYDQLSDAILNNSVTADQQALLNDYLQPMLIHYSMVDYIPIASFEIKNGGLFKHTSENGQAATKEEIDFLTQKHRSYAEFYTRRFIDYMNYNASTKFPEYYSNSNDDMYPDTEANWVGWVL